MLFKINSIKKDMTEDKNRNNKIVKRYKRILFNTENLHFIVGPYYEKTETLLLIEAMYENGFSPNTKDYLGDNLITKSLKDPKTEEFIVSLLKLSIKYGLDVNNVYRHNQTILHNIISSKRYYGNIIPIYNLLKENGYNMLLLNDNYMSIKDLISKSTYIADREEFIELFDKDLKDFLDNKFDELYQKLIEEQRKKNAIHMKKRDFIIDYINYNRLRRGVFYSLPYEFLEENFVLKVVEKLLEEGLDINSCTHYSELCLQRFFNGYRSPQFIYELLKIAVKHNLNVNYIDNKNNTLLHQLIISTNFEGEIMPIYNLFMENGFNDKLKNKDSYTIYELILNNKDYCIYDKNKLLDIYQNKYNKEKKININFSDLNDEDYEFISGFSKELNDKWINRGTNAKVQFKKINIISGKERVGKSKYLIHLYFRLNTEEEKCFIVSTQDMMEKCSTISEFHRIFFKLMRICAENEIILMIDDIDKIYYDNLDDLRKEEISMMIDLYIKRYNLTIIGTINKEKEEIIVNNKILKDSVKLNILEEPKEDVLINIINYLIDNKENNINFINDKTKDLFIKLLVLLSNNKIVNKENISSIKICEDIISILNNLYNNDKDIIDCAYICNAIKISGYFDEKIIDIIKNELLLLNNEDKIILNNIKKLIKEK